MKIYNKQEWESQIATVSAVDAWTGGSVTTDNRASNSTAAFNVPTATTAEFIDCAYDPVNNRVYVMFQYST